MKFKQSPRRKPIEYEKDLVKYWKKHQIFEKSIEQRPAADSYVFYDGPPFITGVPHHGTLLSSVVKDAVPRYWTMKGKRIERVWGWDCHGLPAEVYTERKLGIKSKQDVLKFGLENYIKACRDNMVQTGNEWEDTIDRIGRWVDFKGAYKTMDKPYMESVWWAFKKLYEAGKIYEGEKVLLYCTRDATPIAKAEVAMDNSYKEITDPSVYIKLKLKGEDANLLAWTTTPWTLPANTAAAVNKNLEYVEVQVGEEKFILAKSLLKKVLTDEKNHPIAHKIIRTMKGQELVGKSYEPLFADRGKNAHKIWAAPYVTLEEGTGIVHLAPAYGEEDYELANKNNFPAVTVLDEHGYYTEGNWKGKQVWVVNKQIAQDLHKGGVVWKIDYVQHSYPHCHRCGTPLMYKLHPSWFMDVTGQRTQMLEHNEDIYWFPTHIKKGRFAKNILAAPDWNLSRDRFWATAMPVWKGVDKAGKEYIKVVGSYAELKELAGVELEDYHRPWIDEVTFEIEGVKYQRIDKVFDSWFEAGSMPFAQFHYPFENEAKFEQNFPGDFIAEYVGQVRAWFYYLHALSVGLFQTNSFKNVIVTGTIAGNDGRKMSKSYGNYTDPNELMDQFSADALRFLYLSSPLLSGEDYSLQDKDVSDVSRKLNMIWNMYDFFSLYAEADGWEWNGDTSDPYQDLSNPLDQWIISRLHQLIAEVDRHMTRYDVPGALKLVPAFIDDASNWYVRRSRKRFWKSLDDKDKNLAYRSLHYLLTRLALLLSPFTPFLAEELYQKLTGAESVHLEDWPAGGQVNGVLVDEMAALRELITEGLAQRAEAGIKLRQPLSAAKVNLPFDLNKRADLRQIMLDELNIKRIDFKLDNKSKIAVILKLNPALKREGLAREVVRHIQQYRKELQLKVDDRIKLGLETSDDELKEAMQAFTDMIKAEALADSLDFSDGANAKPVKIGSAKLAIAIIKTKS